MLFATAPMCSGGVRAIARSFTSAGRSRPFAAGARASATVYDAGARPRVAAWWRARSCATARSALEPVGCPTTTPTKRGLGSTGARPRQTPRRPCRHILRRGEPDEVIIAIIGARLDAREHRCASAERGSSGRRNAEDRVRASQTRGRAVSARCARSAWRTCSAVSRAHRAGSRRPHTSPAEISARTGAGG